MNRIPKVIHYCWFGRGKKPKLLKKCIKSWKKFLPDYEIIEWNEDNFNINTNIYVKQAYKSKKYAFVADYARLYALYNYGGIYLDTDLEILKSLDDFLVYDAFVGFEEKNFCSCGVIGSKKKNIIIKSCLDIYENMEFINKDGTLNQKTIPSILTETCLNYGLKLENREQDINVMHIFPKTYFYPLNYDSVNTDFTENTYAIHHFAGSWLPIEEQKRLKKINLYQRRKVFLCKYMNERKATIILEFRWILKNKITQLFNKA